MVAWRTRRQALEESAWVERLAREGFSAEEIARLVTQRAAVGTRMARAGPPARDRRAATAS